MLYLYVVCSTNNKCVVGWVEKLSLLIRHQRGDWQIINNNWVNLKRGCLLFPFGPYGCMSSSLNRQEHSFRKMSIFNNCCVQYVHLILLERTGLKAIWSLVWCEANLTCFICNQCRPRKSFFRVFKLRCKCEHYFIPTKELFSEWENNRLTELH